MYDDEDQLLGNASVRGLENIPRAFTENVWASFGASTNSYRPLHTVTYVLLHEAFGFAPFPYHALNIVLHAASSVLVLGLATATLGAGPIALLAALLFALHPTHAETVAWSAALPDLLAVFFTLFAVQLAVRPRRAARAAAVVMTACALLSKEIGLVAPLLVALRILTARDDANATRRGAPGRTLLDRLPGALLRAAPHLALVPVYIAARLAALGGLSPLRSASPGFEESARAIATRIGEDVFRLLAPFGFWTVTPFRIPATWGDARPIAGLIVLAATAIGLRALARKRPWFVTGVLWFFLPLAPSLYLPLIGQQESVADRYLYMPSIGFAVLAAGALDALSVSRRPIRIAGRPVSAGTLAACCVLAAYAVSTVLLLEPWRSSMKLYDAVLARAPDATYLRIRRGVTYQRLGDTARARADYELAVRGDPDRSEAWLNLGVLDRREGKLLEARTAFERSLALAQAEGSRRREADALVNLGELARAGGQPAAAESLFLLAITADPGHAVAHNNLGALYASSPGRGDDALRELRAATAADPWNSQALENLASLHASRGEWEAAAARLGEAIRIGPAGAQAWVKLGFLQEKIGRPADAVRAYREAVRLDPANAFAAARLDSLR